MTRPNEPAAALAQPIPAAAVPLLSVGAFAGAISVRVTDPLLPHLSQEFGVSLGDASEVVMFFAVAHGLSQLLFGPLGDRYGKYLVVAWSSVACAVTALICAAAPGFVPLLIGRLLAGCTTAALIPLAMAWIGDVVPYQQRQPVLARFLIGQILGLSTGAFVGGLAADWLGWRIPFFVVALIFLVIGVMQLSLNRRLPAHARTVRKADGPALRRMIGEFQQVLALSWARVVLLTAFLEGAFLYGAFAFIASHLYRLHAVSLTTAGALVMLFGFGGFLFATSSARLVQRLGQPGLSLWGGILMAVSLLAIGLAPAWWWAVPGCLIAGLGFYMMHNTLQTNATQMAPERRGSAVSAYAACFFLGQAAGVGAAGMMVEQVGTTAIILAGAVGVLGTAINFNRRLRLKA
jgi:predicted MFS family arabinose efflux permease